MNSDDEDVRVSLAYRAEVEVVDGALIVTADGRATPVHAQWLRERSIEPGSVDPTNRQRLFEPLDVDPYLAVESVVTDEQNLHVTFSDGHRASIAVDHVVAAVLGCADRDEAPPPAVPWRGPDVDVSDLVVDYAGLGRGTEAALEAALTAFFRRGCFVLRGAPTSHGALREITSHFGRLSATNFGEIFDVRTEPVPADLAYTAVGLSAHTDQPYRSPVPGVQFLHTIVNDAPGGHSTLVDGLDVVQELEEQDAEAYEVLSTVPVEFRYDVGTDVKVARAPMIERHPDGSVRQLRFSPRLDFGPLLSPDILEPYYRGRRWLASALNDPRRQIEFRLLAGDVLVVDNHRVLHGRTAFDPTRGSRHLQGCYIDHDGPATEWRLLRRRLASKG